jgi:hypothetical protein
MDILLQYSFICRLPKSHIFYKVWDSSPKSHELIMLSKYCYYVYTYIVVGFPSDMISHMTQAFGIRWRGCFETRLCDGGGGITEFRTIDDCRLFMQRVLGRSTCGYGSAIVGYDCSFAGATEDWVLTAKQPDNQKNILKNQSYGSFGKRCKKDNESPSFY